MSNSVSFYGQYHKNGHTYNSTISNVRKLIAKLNIEELEMPLVTEKMNGPNFHPSKRARSSISPAMWQNSQAWRTYSLEVTRLKPPSIRSHGRKPKGFAIYLFTSTSIDSFRRYPFLLQYAELWPTVVPSSLDSLPPARMFPHFADRAQAPQYGKPTQ